MATDSIPAGKKDNAPLRDQEKAINKDLDDMIVPDGGGLTVLQLVKKYIATKTGVKHTTRAGYGTVINLLERNHSEQGESTRSDYPMQRSGSSNYSR